MANREILQEGNRVRIDERGNRTAVPMSQKPEPRRQRVTAAGLKNPANSKAVEAAGMASGGKVRGYGAARKPMKKGGVCR